MKHTIIGAAVAFVFSAVMTSPASALPSLQLGHNCDPGDPRTCEGWTYVGGGDDTWYYNGESFTLNAYANALSGNGDYAWADKSDTNRYAYLVAAAVPKLGNIGDLFDLTISNATPVASGYGRPPVEDSNDLAPHGIFDTYFEVYEFQFNGPIVDISNTQPGQTGTGEGYKEPFSISWTDLTSSGDPITGLHIDLFTVASGRYAPAPNFAFTKRPQGPPNNNRRQGKPPNNNIVQAFAPYSHDAQSLPRGEPLSVPEPSIMTFLSMGLLSMGIIRLRRRQRG